GLGCARRRLLFLPPPGFFKATALPICSSASSMAAGSSVILASPVAKRLRLTSQASSAACWLDVATTQSVKPMVVRKTLIRGGSLGFDLAMSGADGFAYRDNALGLFQMQQLGHAPFHLDHSLAGVFRQREGGDDGAGARNLLR